MLFRKNYFAPYAQVLPVSLEAFLDSGPSFQGMDPEEDW